MPDLIAPGRYRLFALEKTASGAWERRPRGLYRVLGMATHATIFCRVVVYAGEGEPDDGRLFVCTPYDFQLRFDPEPEAAEAQATAEAPPWKVAGVILEGVHV